MRKLTKKDKVELPWYALGFQGLGYEAGYVGVFTRHWAAGALPSGSRAEKVAGDEGDLHPIGSKCTILGSLFIPEQGLAYFVEWDARPKHAVFVMPHKIKPIP